MAHEQKRMMHKRQRVVATTSVEVTTTLARGGRGSRTSATELAAAIDTTTSSERSQHARPSFLTASTRTTAVPTVATTTAVTTPSTTDDTTSSVTTTAARNRGTTSSVDSTPVTNYASQSTGFDKSTATPINTNPKSSSSDSSSSSGGTNGGAVAGAIIAVIAVLAIGVGFFVWRKRRNSRKMREGNGLIGGGGAAGNGGAGTYRKQDEDQDRWDGNQSGGPGGFTRDDSSLFGGREKTFSQESFGTPPAGQAAGNGGYGATSSSSSSWNQPTQHGQESAWNQNSNVYPPSNQPLPPSTSNLLSHPNQSSNNVLPASLAVGAGAGAAGIGAARLLAAQSQASSSPRASITNTDYDARQHQSIEQRELEQELENRRQSFVNKTQDHPGAPLALGAVVEGPEGESPFGESEGQGEIRIVKGTFDPSLDDELVLYPGDKVQVLMKYDDGWALGLNLSSGVPPSKGVFPFDCLGEEASAPLPSEIRAPGSSPTTANRSLSPINPANIPLPPPTPTLLSPINEDEQQPPFSTGGGPPQLAPFERSDSPLSPDFPPTPTTLSVPNNINNSSPTKQKQKLKRHSSLIASRDADLFVALGEVLDKEKH
ncbi:hypothetical protein JCM16303_006706 [Sporobolomyces ruberrimus]